MGDFEDQNSQETAVVVPDMLLCRTARRFLRAQSELLTAHLDGAKTQRDVEDVHQVRVACRRMRAGLAFFGDCFEDDKSQRWRRQLKKALRRFGPARDFDVQAEFIEQFIKTLDPQQKTVRPGIKRLLLRICQRRETLQPGIAKAVRRLAREHLLVNIHLETERLMYDADHGRLDICGMDFYQRAAEQVGGCLAEVVHMLAALQDADAKRDHHALRIAVKKLRYTLEVCDTGLEGRLKSLLKTLKKIQGLLGELHDCDVWDEQIEAFITEETARTKAFFGHIRPMGRLMPGLRYLQEQRRQNRQQLFAQTAAAARELEAEHFWDRVAQAVRPYEGLQNESGTLTESNMDGDTSDGQ